MDWVYGDDSYSLYEKGYDAYKSCTKCDGDIDYIGYGIYKCIICGKVT